MTQLTLSVDMIIDVPRQPFTAKVTRIVNSLGQDITATFISFCAGQNLSLGSQDEIESAVESFTHAYKSNHAILP